MDGLPSRDLFLLKELAAEYEILGELGRGGTSVVYHARERELGRDVAIKLVGGSQLDDSEASERLAREARLVALLSHPNIVPLLGVRHFSSGLALIMQHVPGSTLKRLIRDDGPLPIDVVEHVLRDIAGALDYAHRRHIVHRDLKPENIYLDMECDRALLADFGIARTTETESTLTLVGTALGTPAYMSPEQIDGTTLDERSDLYSLGLVAHEMLTGQQPWAGCNLYTIIYKQKHDELPSLASVRSDVPAYLQRAVDSLLRKDRDERCRSAAELLALLPATPTSMHAAPAIVARPPEPVAVEETPTLRYQRDALDAPLPTPQSSPPPVPQMTPVLPAPPVQQAPPPRPLAPVPVIEKPRVDVRSVVAAPAVRVTPTRRNGRRRNMVVAILALVVVSASAMTAVMRDRTRADNEWATDQKPAPVTAQRIIPATPSLAPDTVTAVLRPVYVTADQQPPAPVTPAVAASSVPRIRDPDVQLPRIDPRLSAPDFALATKLPNIEADAPSSATPQRAATPEISNREAVQQALLQYYPSMLRENGVGGEVILSVMIGTDGKVLRSRVEESSGVGSLDQAAVRVAKVMRFVWPRGARPDDSTWVQVPVRFQVK